MKIQLIIKKLFYLFFVLAYISSFFSCENNYIEKESSESYLYTPTEYAYTDASLVYDTTDLPVTEPPATEPPVTEPPVTEPTVTEPPVTEPPATEPPVTEPPVTEPPVTEPPATEPPATEGLIIESGDVKIEIDETKIFKSSEVNDIILPQTSSVQSEKNGSVIDTGNASQGYIMIKYKGSSSAQHVVLIEHPSGTKYTTIFSDTDTFEAFTISGGDGTYKVYFCEQAVTRYAVLNSVSFDVKLENEYKPFLYPNYYINYNGNTNAVKLAKYLRDNSENELDFIINVYSYVTENLSYNYDLANTVNTLDKGYVPNLDVITDEKTGICFDYSSLMTAMLRSRGIPSKMVFGYTNGVYHAWISVYTEENGWINGIIRFDGKTWNLMDPTFMSTSENKESTADYIGNPENYSAIYYY